MAGAPAVSLDEGQSCLQRIFAEILGQSLFFSSLKVDQQGRLGLFVKEFQSFEKRVFFFKESRGKDKDKGGFGCLF